MAYNSRRWLIDAELPQLREEGREVSDLSAEWATLKERDAANAELETFYQRILAVPAPVAAPYVYPLFCRNASESYDGARRSV